MKYVNDLLLRIIIAITIPLKFYYFLFFPLTIYPVYLLLSILGYPVLLDFTQKMILSNGISIRLIDACIAGFAYFLLTLLILFTKDIEWKKRIKMWLIGCFLILIFNLIRISILAILLLNSQVNYFNFLHYFFWYFFSGAIVVVIWIYLTKKFKIKAIPVYSDFKELYKNSYLKK